MLSYLFQDKTLLFPNNNPPASFVLPLFLICICWSVGISQEEESRSNEKIGVNFSLHKNSSMTNNDHKKNHYKLIDSLYRPTTAAKNVTTGVVRSQANTLSRPNTTSFGGRNFTNKFLTSGTENLLKEKPSKGERVDEIRIKNNTCADNVGFNSRGSAKTDTTEKHNPENPNNCTNDLQKDDVHIKILDTDARFRRDPKPFKRWWPRRNRDRYWRPPRRSRRWRQRNRRRRWRQKPNVTTPVPTSTVLIDTNTGDRRVIITQPERRRNPNQTQTGGSTSISRREGFAYWNVPPFVLEMKRKLQQKIQQMSNILYNGLSETLYNITRRSRYIINKYTYLKEEAKQLISDTDDMIKDVVALGNKIYDTVLSITKFERRLFMRVYEHGHVPTASPVPNITDFTSRDYTRQNRDSFIFLRTMKHMRNKFFQLNHTYARHLDYYYDKLDRIDDLISSQRIRIVDLMDLAMYVNNKMSNMTKLKVPKVLRQIYNEKHKLITENYYSRRQLYMTERSHEDVTTFQKSCHLRLQELAKFNYSLLMSLPRPTSVPLTLTEKRKLRLLVNKVEGHSDNLVRNAAEISNLLPALIKSGKELILKLSMESQSDSYKVWKLEKMLKRWGKIPHSMHGKSGKKKWMKMRRRRIRKMRERMPNSEHRVSERNRREADTQDDVDKIYDEIIEMLTKLLKKLDAMWIELFEVSPSGNVDKCEQIGSEGSGEGDTEVECEVQGSGKMDITETESRTTSSLSSAGKNDNDDSNDFEFTDVKAVMVSSHLERFQSILRGSLSKSKSLQKMSKNHQLDVQDIKSSLDEVSGKKAMLEADVNASAEVVDRYNEIVMNATEMRHLLKETEQKINKTQEKCLAAQKLADLVLADKDELERLLEVKKKEKEKQEAEVKDEDEENVGKKKKRRLRDKINVTDIDGKREEEEKGEKDGDENVETDILKKELEEKEKTKAELKALIEKYLQLQKEDEEREKKEGEKRKKEKVENLEKENVEGEKERKTKKRRNKSKNHSNRDNVDDDNNNNNNNNEKPRPLDSVKEEKKRRKENVDEEMKKHVDEVNENKQKRRNKIGKRRRDEDEENDKKKTKKKSKTKRKNEENAITEKTKKKESEIDVDSVLEIKKNLEDVLKKLDKKLKKSRKLSERKRRKRRRRKKSESTSNKRNVKQRMNEFALADKEIIDDKKRNEKLNEKEGGNENEKQKKKKRLKTENEAENPKESVEEEERKENEERNENEEGRKKKRKKAKNEVGDPKESVEEEKRKENEERKKKRKKVKNEDPKEGVEEEANENEQRKKKRRKNVKNEVEDPKESVEEEGKENEEMNENEERRKKKRKKVKNEMEDPKEGNENEERKKKRKKVKNEVEDLKEGGKAEEGNENEERRKKKRKNENNEFEDLKEGNENEEKNENEEGRKKKKKKVKNVVNDAKSVEEEENEKEERKKKKRKKSRNKSENPEENEEEEEDEENEKIKKTKMDRSEREQNEEFTEKKNRKKDIIEEENEKETKKKRKREKNERKKKEKDRNEDEEKNIKERGKNVEVKEKKEKDRNEENYEKDMKKNLNEKEKNRGKKKERQTDKNEENNFDGSENTVKKRKKKKEKDMKEEEKNEKEDNKIKKKRKGMNSKEKKNAVDEEKDKDVEDGKRKESRNKKDFLEEKEEKTEKGTRKKKDRKKEGITEEDEEYKKERKNRRKNEEEIEEKEEKTEKGTRKKDRKKEGITEEDEEYKKEKRKQRKNEEEIERKKKRKKESKKNANVRSRRKMNETDDETEDEDEIKDEDVMKKTKKRRKKLDKGDIDFDTKKKERSKRKKEIDISVNMSEDLVEEGGRDTRNSSRNRKSHRKRRKKILGEKLQSPPIFIQNEEESLEEEMKNKSKQIENDVYKSKSAVESIVKQLKEFSPDPCTSISNNLNQLRLNVSQIRQKIQLARTIVSAMKIPVSLNGKQRLEVMLDRKDESREMQTSVEICIQPKSSNSAILSLHANNSHSYSLALADSKPLLTIWDANGDVLQKLEADTELIQDNWYQLLIRRIGQNFSLSINPTGSKSEGFTVRKLIPDFPPEQIPFSLASLGGYPENFPISNSDKLKGCIAYLNVNGHSTHILSPLESGSYPHLCKTGCESVGNISMVFEGNGFALLESAEIFKKTLTSVRLSFKTFQKNSLLMAIKKNSKIFFLVALIDGNILVESKVKSSSVAKQSQGINFSNGDRHTILVNVLEDQLEINTSAEKIEFEDKDSESDETFFEEGISLGGLGSNFRNESKYRSFTGCLSNVSIDDTILNLLYLKDGRHVYQGDCQENTWISCAQFTESSSPVTLTKYVHVRSISLMVSVQSQGMALFFERDSKFSIGLQFNKTSLKILNYQEDESKIIPKKNNSGFWHLLHIEDQKGNIHITLDGEESVDIVYTEDTSGWFAASNADDFSMVVNVGGLPKDHDSFKKSDSFIGSISTLFIQHFRPNLNREFASTNNLLVCAKPTVEVFTNTFNCTPSIGG